MTGTDGVREGSGTWAMWSGVTPPVIGTGAKVLEKGDPVRVRIIIDTQDDDGGDKPFTLIAHRDDDDGTQTREPLDIGGGSVVGGSIPRMLRELADAWENGDVTGWDGPMPRTADEWRTESAP